MPDYDAIILNLDGSKKFYEIGSFAAFMESDMKFKAVCAGGMGAINAAFFSMKDMDKIVKFWTMAVGKNLFKVSNLIAGLYEYSWSKLSKKGFVKEFAKFLSTDKRLKDLKKALREYINEDDVRNSDIKLFFDVIDLNTMEFTSLSIDDIPKGQLHSYILLCVCFPEISNMDSNMGGMQNYNGNLIDVLLENGYDNIISTEEMLDKSSLKKITIIKSSDFLELEDKYNTDVMKEHIKIGYLNTLKVLKKVWGKYYYINFENDSSYTLFEKHMGDSFNDNKDYLIMELLALDSNNKNLIRKTLCDMIRFSEYRKESNALISLMENLSNIFGIEEKEKYTFTKLKNEIEKTYKNEVNSHLRKIEDKNYLSKMINGKEEILCVDKDNFLDYFLVLISANPRNYERLYANIFNKINDKMRLGIVTLLYLLY
ncbi:hypothetical protein [Anaerofustis butyriciformans]|uniref:hypothetical protein n=1 Tax=Anaerofustis TaxID=264995 RepID=UPI003F8AEDB9